MKPPSLFPSSIFLQIWAFKRPRSLPQRNELKNMGGDASRRFDEAHSRYFEEYSWLTSESGSRIAFRQTHETFLERDVRRAKEEGDVKMMEGLSLPPP